MVPPAAALEANDDEINFNQKEISQHKIIIGKHIHNTFSCSYFGLLEIVGDWLCHLEAWLQGCRCHPGVLKSHFPDGFVCPVSGCRMIDMANGDLNDFIQEIADTSAGRLTARCIALGATRVDRAAINLDFGRAKAALVTETGLRCKPVVGLPQRSIAIGQEDDEQALLILADCTLQFEVLSDRCKQKAHPRIRRMFTPGTEFMDSACEALENGQMPDIGPLAGFRWECQLAKSNEISVEMRHRILNGFLARAKNHSEGYQSAMSRRDILQAKVAAEPAEMVEAFGKCMNGARCVEALGMKHHPAATVDVLSEGLASKIIYCNEPSVQWRDSGEPFSDDDDEDDDDQPHDGADGGGKKSEDHGAESSSDSSDSDDDGSDGGDKPGGDDRKKSFDEDVRAQRMFDHFKARWSKDCFYSVRLTKRQTLFPKLQLLRETLEPLKHTTTAEWLTKLGDKVNEKHVQLALAWVQNTGPSVSTDVPGMNAQARASEMADGIFSLQHEKMRQVNTIFFRLVHTSVAAIEQQDDIEEYRLYGPDSLAIEIRPVIAADIKSKHMLLAGEGQVYTLDGRELIKQSQLIYVWKQAPCLHMFNDAFVRANRSLMSTFTMAVVYGQLYDRAMRKLHGVTDQVQFHNGSIQEIASLQQLQRFKFAEKVEVDGVSEFSNWHLLQLGIESAGVTVMAIDGTQLVNFAGEVDDCTKTTVVDCLIFLASKNWICKPVAELHQNLKSKKAGQTDGSSTPQEFFVASNGSQHVWYLRCMVAVALGKLEEPVKHRGRLSFRKKTEVRNTRISRMRIRSKQSIAKRLQVVKHKKSFTWALSVSHMCRPRRTRRERCSCRRFQ